MKHAFSLVELSIVLVILGLLTGGILAGQSLIRAAELRSLMADVDRYMAATYTFRDKYFAMPGDFNKAEDFWGPWATSGTPESVTGAKNGNNDGYVGGTTLQFYEGVQFWRHLALAGLIEGNYVGNYAEPSHVVQRGLTVPALKIGNGRGGVSTLTPAGPSPIFGARGQYMLMQGEAVPWSLLTPPEAWNVDTKRDDGNPSTGMVLGMAEGALASRNCTTNDDWQNAAAGSATYKLEVSTVGCWMLFWFR